MFEFPTFAAWLAAQMASRRLSQTELAQLIGASSTSNISRWLNLGARPEPEICEVLAEKLGVDVMDLLRLAGWLKRPSPEQLAEDAPAYLSADLTRAIAIARQLIAAGGAEALEEWEDIGESVLRAYQKRQARD